MACSHVFIENSTINENTAILVRGKSKIVYMTMKSNKCKFSKLILKWPLFIELYSDGSSLNNTSKYVWVWMLFDETTELIMNILCYEHQQISTYFQSSTSQTTDSCCISAMSTTWMAIIVSLQSFMWACMGWHAHLTPHATHITYCNRQC